MRHTACRMHPAARLTWKLGQFLHPAFAGSVQQAVGCVTRLARCIRQLAGRGNLACASIRRPAGSVQQSIGWDHPAHRKHPAARRTRKPGRFLHPASRRKHPTAHWMRHPSHRKHPASHRTWKPAGFSIQRLAGCVQRPAGSIRRLAGRGNQPVSRSNASPDASSSPLDASPGTPDGEIGRFLHPASRRTRPTVVGCVTRPAGCIQQSVGCVTRNAGRGNRPVSPSNVSPDASSGPLDASTRPPFLARQEDPAQPIKICPCVIDRTPQRHWMLGSFRG
jgi:hypothetical protein